MFKFRSGSLSTRRVSRSRWQRIFRPVSLTVVVAMLTLGAAGCDWAQFGFETGGSRFNSTESVISTANVSTLVQRFSAPTGAAIFFSSPAISNDVAYIGSEDDKFYAFDATSGTLLWTANATNIVDSSPAVADGVVYVSDGNGTLYAFDAAGKTNCTGTPKTCSPLWTSPRGGGSPTVSDGVVYVTGGGVLSAINAASGATLWSATTNGTLSDPVEAAGVVYVGFAVLVGHVAVAEVQAYDASSGALLWTGAVQPGNLNFPPSPAVAGVPSTSAPSTTALPFPHSTRLGTPIAQAPPRPARRCGRPEPLWWPPHQLSRTAWCTEALTGTSSLLMRRGTRTVQASPRPAPRCGLATMAETTLRWATRQRSPTGSSMSGQRTTTSYAFDAAATSGARRRPARPATLCGQQQRVEVWQPHLRRLSRTVWSTRDRSTTTSTRTDSHN